MSLLSGIDRITVIDPATDVAVALGKISSASGYTPENILSETTTGAVWGGKGWNWNIVFHNSDPSALAQLDTWMDNDTEVIAVGSGQSGCILWFHPVTIDKNSNLDMNARNGASGNTVIFLLSNPFGDVRTGKNLFATAGAIKSDGKLPADNSAYTPKRAFNGASLSNRGTSMAVSTTERGLEFYFPLEGATITLSALRSSGTLTVKIIALDSAGNPLSTQTGTSASSDRAVATMTVPAGTEKIRLILSQSASGTATEIAARFDGRTTFTNE